MGIGNTTQGATDTQHVHRSQQDGGSCRFERAAVPEDMEEEEQAPQESFFGDLTPTVNNEGRTRNNFEFELHHIKALPVSAEPTMVLVSRCGDASEELSRDLGIKRRGETALRNCGVAYTIVRPQMLLQEPGGYRALVFDQGDRIEQVRIPLRFVGTVCRIEDTASFRKHCVCVCVRIFDHGDRVGQALVSGSSPLHVDQGCAMLLSSPWARRCADKLLSQTAVTTGNRAGYRVRGHG